MNRIHRKPRVCLKNHSRNLHAPLCGIFRPNSVVVARYDALIRAKSPTNCDAHLAESLFQTRSRRPGAKSSEYMISVQREAVTVCGAAVTYINKHRQNIYNKL